jgi:hypothetical protein
MQRRLMARIAGGRRRHRHSENFPWRASHHGRRASRSARYAVPAGWFGPPVPAATLRGGAQRSVPARPAWRSRMIVPRMPEARRPGPSGPDRFSPTGGSFRSAARTSSDMLASCRSISSLSASGRSGAASPVALAAYAAAPRAWAPMCGIAEACPAARAAAAAAGPMPCTAPRPAKRRRIWSATSSSPRTKARVRAIVSCGRLSPGASASKNGSTRSAQSAAHAATIRRSASLSVCGEPTRGFCRLQRAHPL